MSSRSPLGVFLSLMLIFTVVTAVAVAQHPKNKENRIDGTIQMINRDDKLLTLRIGTAATQRQVAYTDETKITRQNNPGGVVDDLKEGTRVICVGHFNDKSQLVATRIDIRLPK